MGLDRHILVIDDEPYLRRSMVLILEEAGYRVTAVGSVNDAIQKLQDEIFDLVFLDIQLPDRSGIDLLRLARKDHPDLPILILTGNATLDTAVEAVRYGARDYLLKPVRPTQFLSRLSELFDERDQPKRRRELVDQMELLLQELREVEGEPVAPEIHPNSGEAHRILRCGSLTLNLLTRQAFLADNSVRLPPTTFDYLVTLVRHSPNPVLYETLVQESQGYSVTRSEAREMAGWHIHELRKNIEAVPGEPRMIITVRNVGYRFVP